jgi:hypothetical protein
MMMIPKWCYHLHSSCGTVKHCPFSGLVVSMLASGTRVRRFKPGRSSQVFSGVKILSMPSFGREVKPWVPCHRFALKNPCDYIEVGSKAKFCRPFLARAFLLRLNGSGLCRELHCHAAWAPLELTEKTKRSGAQRASVIQA